jgi:hypothetical protein
MVIRDPLVLLDALDELVRSSRPIRFTSQLMLDRDQAYAILDELRGAIIAPIREVSWYRLKREEEHAEPLGSAQAPDVLDAINNLDDLVRKSLPVPLSASNVRVTKERLSDAVDALRAWIVPVAKEIADYRSLYPEVEEQRLAAEQREPSELLKLIDEVDGLVLAAKPIPLTLQMRLDPAPVTAVTARMRTALFRDVDKPSELQALIDKLDDLVQHAHPVLFTKQVRIDPEAMFDILDEMRAALGRARIP